MQRSAYDSSVDRYEITVDVGEEDAVMLNTEEQVDECDASQRLKSAVTRRRGRGFSSAQGHDTQPTMMVPQSLGIIAERSVEGWIVFVTGVHEEASEEDLLDAFSDYGKIKECKLVLDHRTGYVKGYALIEYWEYREAKGAIEAMDGRPILDRPIKCDFAFIKTPPPKEQN